MQLIINILISCSSYALIAYSFQLIYKVSKFLHVAHAVSIAIAAYLTFLFSIQLNLPFVLSIISSIISCVFIMYLIQRFVYKPLLSLGTENWQMLIASLGIYVVMQNLVSIIWGDRILSFRFWEVSTGYRLLGAHITTSQIIIVITSLSLIFIIEVFLNSGVIGRKIKAVSSNLELSNLFGISSEEVTKWVFALGSSLAAFAGILISSDTDMTPNMGFNWLLYGVVAMIIGGLGKSKFILVGSLVLASSQHLAAWYLDSKWMNAVAYIILISFLYWKPLGFSGTRIRKIDL